MIVFLTLNQFNNAVYVYIGQLLNSAVIVGSSSVTFYQPSVACVMCGQKFQRIKYDTLRYAPPLCVSLEYCNACLIVCCARVPRCFMLCTESSRKLSSKGDW